MANGNTGSGFEHTGQVAGAGMYLGGECLQCQFLIEVMDDVVLYLVDVVIDMPAVLEVDALLGIVTITTDVDYHFSGE